MYEVEKKLVARELGQLAQTFYCLLPGTGV